MGRVDLARHDRGARLVLRQDQFAKTRARTRSQQANVVGDLEQAGCHRIDRTMHHDIGIVRSQRLEFVGGAGERQLGDFGGMFCEQFGEARLGIEPGPDRGAALRQRIQILHRRAQPRDAALDLRGVTGEFLTERQRRRILRMGSTDLDDLGEGFFLLAQLAMQLLQGRNQVGKDACRGGDMHRGRK